MKMVLIAGLAVLLLGGGAGGAYIFLNKPAEASLGEVDAAAQEAAKAAAQAPIVPTVFVELHPLILPIIDDNGISQTVSLVVSVEVVDQAAADKVKNLQPRLHDAFIQDMYGALNRRAVMNGGVIEVSKIKERLNRVSASVVGENTIKDVLLQVVRQRGV